MNESKEIRLDELVIISTDGNPHTTRIETGAGIPIRGVTAITWTADNKGITTVITTRSTHTNLRMKGDQVVVLGEPGEAIFLWNRWYTRRGHVAHRAIWWLGDRPKAIRMRWGKITWWMNDYWTIIANGVTRWVRWRPWRKK